jgi:Protein of unknown function (DUF1566)
MNNQARQHLFQVINDYGIDVVKDARRFESLLKDYTQGQYKREVFLCVQAAREGVIEALQNNKHLPYEMVAARLTKQLHEDYGLDLHAAKWAVGSWVVVLGLTDKFPRPKPPIIKQPKPVKAAPVQAPPPLILHNRKPIVIHKLVANRYSDQGDGTVVDTQTGAHWMRFALGQTWNGKTNITEAKRYTWQEALNAADSFNQSGGFAGYQDWRVPTIDELKTIIERGKKPAINHAMFPATPLSFFWSSTSVINVNHSAWAVYFYGGSAYWYGKTSYYYIRLVRN